MWIDLIDQGIPLLLLIALGLVLFRGFKKNHILLFEREDLLKRYLIFRGDKQVRLKIFGEDEKAYQELLKTISTSWKNFKKTYDDYRASFVRNTARTKLFLQLITLGLLLNSLRLFLSDLLLLGRKGHLLSILLRELSIYVLVVLSFCLLKTQTHRFLLSRGKAAEMDREILFFPNGSSDGGQEGLYNEFDPIEAPGGMDEKDDQDPRQ